MPVVFRYEGYRFFFYSNEGDPREPVHIHVRSADSEAKFWLRPEVVLAYNEGFNARTLSLLARVTEENRTLFEQAWHDYFG
jgi:hypothetical protein